MAETILFQFSKFVIAKLSSVVFNEMKSALGVEHELDRIESNLSSIQAVLRDAEKQQSTSDSIANWLRSLRDLMYDIDDLLDEIATEVAIRDKNKGLWRKKVSTFFSVSNSSALRLVWAHKAKNLCKKLSRVAEDRKNFVLLPDFADSSYSSTRETHSKVNESDILGRDQDKEAIVKSILGCENRQKVSVLPIVGIGGIGKTTLAKLVYNDSRIGSCFAKRLWVHVSVKSNVKKILRQIISMFTGEDLVQLIMEQLTLEQLRIKAEEALTESKYCLVLDDVWNTDLNEWMVLKEMLDVGAEGSVIVVTTRDLKVASMVQSVGVYELGKLSVRMCLIMFMKLAFKGCDNIQVALVKLAIEIVMMSRGLPLLVTVLGNLLQGKTDEREWRILMKKIDEGHEDIMEVLKLSYEQLPSHLKLCFRICSIYGKGEVINAIDVLTLWMALGFVPEANQGELVETLEYIGLKYIDELSSKSLFQVIKDDLIFCDDFSNLVMHDTMYDLAKHMAGDELAIISSATKDVSKSTRYIRLDEDYLSANQSHHPLFNKASKARLLMLKTSEHPLSKSFLQSIFSNLKCLRVLDLENSQFEELPSTIGDMKHLRYLCLQNNTELKLLPNSVCNLLNLQSLLLDGCVSLKEVPSQIGRLENLRGLSVTTQQELLPQGIWLLASLRLLVLKDCPRLSFIPSSTKQLRNLELLLIQDCKQLDLVHESRSLEGLSSLRMLIIKGLPKFQKLQVGAPHLPFTSLQILVIYNCEHLTILTDWIEHFTSLKTLLISGCPNLVTSPQIFNKLKRLEVLHIDGLDMLVRICSPQRGTISSNLVDIMTAQLQ